MTNDELKALCLQVECSSFERDVAESILRLLAQCEAMRVEIAALQMVNKALCGDSKTREMADKALEEYRRVALSQLGERT